MAQNNTHYRFLHSAATGLMIVFLLGCGGSKPSRYYSLTPVRGVTGELRKEPLQHIAIGIRTLKLPQYLLRDQIVMRTGNDEIAISEFNRWAEPLEENFKRVLIEDLSRDVPTNSIFLFPAHDTSVTNCQILLEITQFELQKDNSVVLSARWGISRGEAVVFLMDKHSSFTEMASDDRADRYGSIAAAMSRLTGKLSEEIASEIRSQAAAGK